MQLIFGVISFQLNSSSGSASRKGSRAVTSASKDSTPAPLSTTGCRGVQKEAEVQTQRVEFNDDEVRKE